jgi:hypothetical protein
MYGEEVACDEMDVRILHEPDTLEKLSITDIDFESDIELDIRSFSEEDFSFPEPSHFPEYMELLEINEFNQQNDEEESIAETSISKRLRSLSINSLSSNNNIANDKIANKLVLRNRQELNILTYLLDLCISQEIEKIANKTSVTHLQDKPFLNFVYTKLIKTFPIIPENYRAKFWGNVETFFRYLIRLKLSSSDQRGEISYASQSYVGVKKILVILFKNILRTPITRQKAKLEEEMEWGILQNESNLQTETIRTDIHDGKLKIRHTSEKSLPMVIAEKSKRQTSLSPILDSIVLENYECTETQSKASVITKKKTFFLEIVATRSSNDKNQGTYQEYIIEAKFGNKIGRTAHRYSNFEILHNTVI